MTPAVFLRACAAEPWQVGWSDCIGVVARWIEHCGRGRATAYLPPAGDEEAARLWLGVQGGLKEAMRTSALKLDLGTTPTPKPGDVAHLYLADGQETAAIRMASAWGARGRGGLLVLRDRLVTPTVWSLDLGR